MSETNSRGSDTDETESEEYNDYEWLAEQASFHIEKYHDMEELEDIESAIDYLEEALLFAPQDHPDVPILLNNYSYSLVTRFGRLGKPTDLDKAIEYQHQALSLTPEGDPSMPGWLNNLGSLLNKRFEHLGELVDLDKAVAHKQQAVSLALLGDSNTPAFLADLGYLLQTRFEHTGKLLDISQAVDWGRQAVSVSPQGNPKMPDWLSTLGNSLLARFNRIGELEDLEKAAQCHRQAVSLTSENHEKLPIRLHGLGVSLYKRFQRIGESSDLEEAINRIDQAVSLTSSESVNLSTQLYSLGLAFQSRFLRLGRLADLEIAIRHHIQAVSLTPQGDTETPAQLSALGASLHRRFERLGKLADIHQAIKHQLQAVSLTPHNNPDMPSRLTLLGASLRSQFNFTGQDADLEAAIKHQQQAILCTPQDHPDMPEYINNLGILLRTRFEYAGKLVDLDKAIECYHQAVPLTPQGHPHMPARLSNLGLSLQSRFRRLDEVADLEMSIDYLQQAISQTPQDHPEMPVRLNNLSISLQTRFEHLGEVSDIDKAVEYQDQAVILVPHDHPNRPIWLSNLGLALQIRFQSLGKLIDLNSAIEHQRQSVALTSQHHPNLLFGLNNLSISLYSRFELLDEVTDLNHAVEYYSQAVLIAPQGYPDIPAMLANLGSAFHSRFKCQGAISDINQSIACFQRAAQESIGIPYDRFRAALNWIKLCARHQTESLLHAYSQAMTLLPQMVWIGSTVRNRYRNIVNAGTLCSEAVAIAILREEYPTALEWLEEGRSIVWKQILQLRTPVDDLMAVDPTLAAELRQIAFNLEDASSQRPSGNIESSTPTSLEHTVQRHRRLAEKWETLVDKIRDLPDFRDFLRPRKASELVLSAHSSNVVIINVHKIRCDALIIRQGGNEISHVPLVKFSLEKAGQITAKWNRSLRMRGSDERAFIRPSPKFDDTIESSLAVLWEEVVNPVLEFLEFTKKNTSIGDPPRLTWCTTGQLSFLPLHAAGNYSAKSMVFNYVVSSYTPTLSTLLSPIQPPETFSGILAVGQKSTPGMRSLPGTEAELVRIQKQFRGHVVTQIDEDKATPAAVLAAMEEHCWVHFACHATQNTETPTESAFHLHLGTLDLETITHKQLKHAELAFLSACETATGDEKLPEEAIHLAAGMLMAGYRTVIATMWSIGDDDAPLVAEKVYEHLLIEGVPDARKTAVAVHKATKCLREKVGVREFVKWAPYIHIGL